MGLWCQVHVGLKTPTSGGLDPLTLELGSSLWKGDKRARLLWGLSDVMKGRTWAGWCLAHKRWWRLWLWLLWPLISACGHWLCQLLWGRGCPHWISLALVRFSFSCLLPRDIQVYIRVCKIMYLLDLCYHSPSTPLIFKFKVILDSWHIPKYVFRILRVVMNNPQFRICLVKPSNNT